MRIDHVRDLDIRTGDYLEGVCYDSDEEEQGRAIVEIKKVFRPDAHGLPYDGIMHAA